jgi:tetratricopeptide (TPR) repeat protein
MAYNKSKYVEAAQKLLNQGKVAQAIAEYQQILKHEPKDQVTLMTIGELYIRQGETFQATDYFERLAQLFVSDGFLTKAIAVYKRIAKLAPEEIRPLEKLADLYVQQGVMSEARPLFLQLAEIHLKANHQSEAVSLLKKLLIAEPDNIRIQIRLADLYHAMGHDADAIEAYVSASQRALARGDHGECEKLADRALKLDPKNASALTVKARAHSSQSNFKQAAHILQQASGLEKGGEQAELLLDMYIKNSSWDDAGALAARIIEADPKNFGPTQKLVEALLAADEGDQAMAVLDRLRGPLMDAGEHEIVGKLLGDLAAGLPGRVKPLEWLVDFYSRTSDSFRLPDALAQLGEALLAAGQLDRAKDAFEKLVERQPDGESAKRKLHGVLRKMGLLAPEAPKEEIPEPEPTSSAPVELPEPPAAKLPSAEVEPSPDVAADAVSTTPKEDALDEETQKFITQSLTDVDLFASYGLTQKAIGLLEAVLRRAPRHVPTLEKLLDFVLGAGDDRRTAELAALLENIHNEAGDVHGAERFGELRRRFQRAAGLTDADLAAAQEAPVGEALPAEQAAVAEAESTPVDAKHVEAKPVEAKPVEAKPAETEEVHEVDLSDEWASMIESAAPAEAEPAAKNAAPVAPDKSAEDSGVAEFEIPVESVAAEENAAPAAEIPVEPAGAEKVPATPSGKGSGKKKPKEPEPAPESEFELEQSYELVLDAEPLVPAHEQKPPQAPAAPSKREPEPVAQNAAPAQSGSFESDQFLADLAQELDELGIGDLTIPGPSAKPSQAPSADGNNNSAGSAAKAAAGGALESGPLKEVFDEFRAELGEMSAEDEHEDLETHYNLGTAFREMGLLEEAISEFQKVAKANERGRPFRYAMQCCTLLGLCFMEKGQPAIAAIWYERALCTPNIESESVLALRYDLGVAQESAGELDAARKSFSQVYAVNIDYRDVGERIAALQKTTR